MDKSENFHQQLRDIIPKISEARINVLKAETELKRVFWKELCIAKDDGERSYNAQKSKAESDDTVHHYCSLKIPDDCKQRKPLTQFEEWRTKMAI